jgi:hypothetical protein
VQRQGIAPEFNQERAVKGLSRFVEPIGRPMTSSIGTIVPVTLLIPSQNRSRNYAPDPRERQQRYANGTSPVAERVAKPYASPSASPPRRHSHREIPGGIDIYNW